MTGSVVCVAMIPLYEAEMKKDEKKPAKRIFFIAGVRISAQYLYVHVKSITVN